MTIKKTKEELRDDLMRVVDNLFHSANDTLQFKATSAIAQDVFPGTPVRLWRITFDLLLDDEEPTNE